MLTDTVIKPVDTTTDHARARANLYGFLAAWFSSHPTHATVRALGEMAATLGIPCPGGLTLQNLDAEYMSLFVVPGPRYVAPYESVYRDRWQVPAALRPGSNPTESSITIKGLLMGESTLAVLDAYRRAGVHPEAELPDHLANELRFMAFLWSCEANDPVGRAGQFAELRVEFCKQHLLKWVHELGARVSESGHQGHYAVALDLVERLLEDETDSAE